MTRLFRYAFNYLNLHRIETDCAVNNIESLKLLEKLEMVREGKKENFYSYMKNGLTALYTLYYMKILQTKKALEVYSLKIRNINKSGPTWARTRDPLIMSQVL